MIKHNKYKEIGPIKLERNDWFTVKENIITECLSLFKKGQIATKVVVSFDDYVGLWNSRSCEEIQHNHSDGTSQPALVVETPISTVICYWELD